MPTTKDLDLLRAMADFRLATIPLLATRLCTSEQMIRRRCRQMTNCGLLHAFSRGLGQGRGRPEWVYALNPEGVRQLIHAKLLPTDVPVDQVTGEQVERMAEHQLLVNWLMVQAHKIQKSDNDYVVRFISETSPFHLSKNGSSILRDQVEFPDGKCIPLIPDATFCIAHKGLGKSLLFFLEVDMGTETVADPKRLSNNDLRRKIIVYRTYLVRRGYKRYESQKLFNASFKGFRLLLVANTEARCLCLCRLIQMMQPLDFVWIGHSERICSEDFGNSLWNRGGDCRSPCSSFWLFSRKCG